MICIVSKSMLRWLGMATKKKTPATKARSVPDVSIFMCCSGGGGRLRFTKAAYDATAVTADPKAANPKGQITPTITVSRKKGILPYDIVLKYSVIGSDGLVHEYAVSPMQGKDAPKPGYPLPESIKEIIVELSDVKLTKK